jgi:hypothetical protein
MAVRKAVREFKYTKEFLDRLFGDDLHAKRVHSLANATLGVMTSASLAVCTIGHGLALARGGLSKHAIKQVDRLLSNPGIDVKELFMRWVPSMIGSRKEVEIAMDWTDFDADNQSTIMLSLLTSHGRATPLVWLTVDGITAVFQLVPVPCRCRLLHLHLLLALQLADTFFGIVGERRIWKARNDIADRRDIALVHGVPFGPRRRLSLIFMGFAFHGEETLVGVDQRHQ